MKTNLFKRMCENLTEISKLDNEQREKHLQLFMSQGYLFLDLTDKQVDTLKNVLKGCFPNDFITYNEPDEHGFVAEFKYLRFK